MRERKINRPIVSIMKSKNEQQSIVAALELLPIKDILKEGSTVVITPNWVNAADPSTGTIVGPESLRQLIRYTKGYNPGKIIVATGSGGEKTSDIFHKIGYDNIIREEAVEFVDVNFGPFIDLPLEHDVIPLTKINKLLEELDVLISFAQLKQHEEATITATIKNIALGWPPAEVHGYPKKSLGIHEDLHGFITAMAKKIPIDIAIISVDKAMIGTGPSGGVTVDTEGLVIASTDAVAADTIGARLLGFLPQGIHYLYDLYKANVGEADPKNMDIRGLSLEEAERIFSKAAYGQEVILDKDKIMTLHAQ
jgi:uncharacterized protein (DUF362 family)